MQNISIQTGVREYTLNDAVTVRFNPTDMSFVERLFAAFDELDKQQDGLKKRIAEAGDGMEIFGIAREMDSAMREKIDALFGQPVCEALLGTVNIYALADGLPIWANLLLAVMDEVDTSYAREQKATNPRVQKYLQKYKKTN